MVQSSLFSPARASPDGSCVQSAWQLVCSDWHVAPNHHLQALACQIIVDAGHIIGEELGRIFFTADFTYTDLVYFVMTHIHLALGPSNFNDFVQYIEEELVAFFIAGAVAAGEEFLIQTVIHQQIHITQIFLSGGDLGNIRTYVG